MKNKILEFFFVQYFNGTEHEQVEDIIEERLILVSLSFLKESFTNTTDKNSKTIKDIKIIKHLIKINKFLQKLVKAKTIEVELEDYKTYLKFYKKFTGIIENSQQNVTKNGNSHNEQSEEQEKLYGITKIALLLLIQFLKHPNEYSDIIGDLYQITKFDDSWLKVFTDIFISVLHKGTSKY